MFDAHRGDPGFGYRFLLDEAREAKLYLCAIKDVYSNRFVGYSIDSRLNSRIAVTALDNAVARRRAEGGVVAGCRRVGAAGDNAAMESFFSLCRRTSSTEAS